MTLETERWDIRPLRWKREKLVYAAVIECDEIARTATRHRARLLDLACIVRGYAGLIIGRQKPFEARKTPERVRRLGDALARARRVAAGFPEKNA